MYLTPSKNFILDGLSCSYKFCLSLTNADDTNDVTKVDILRSLWSNEAAIGGRGRAAQFLAC
jgi:hypothetical protein